MQDKRDNNTKESRKGKIKQEYCSDFDESVRYIHT
jgi:hypothetical protein